MITLYDFAPAPSPRRARIFMAEKGLQNGKDFETVQVDFSKKEQMGEAFAAINPRCAVPALKTKHGVITENLAIASYLDDLHPEPPLMGRTPFEKALVLEWNWRVEFEGLYAVADILRNTSPAMKNRAMTGPRNIAQLPELAERGRLRLGYFYEDLNARLTQSPYVAGESFSLADISALVLVDFDAWVKASPEPSLSALHDWHTKISARSSAKA